MPTMITVPIGQRTKSIQFGAAYSPSLSFNPDKELLAGCSGILSGLGLTINTGPNPDQVTVAAGSFIQRGIIVDVTSSQIVEVPDPTVYPLYLVAENANEVHNSSVQYVFTTTPAADSAIIAEWPSAPITAPVIPIHISLCGLKDAIETVASLAIQRENFIASAGQTVFTIPGPKQYQPGSNKLFVYRNGKKLELNADYAENSPTQFTTNFASVLNDVYDCIIFQGAPPIAGLALLDLTDVTSNLANGLKDPTVLRAAPTTSANPLATMADVSAAVAPPKGIVASAVFTSGDYAVPGGGMADVPDGVGFVQVVYNVAFAGQYFLDVDFVGAVGGTFPSDGGMDVGCSVNTVDQGFVYPGPYVYAASSNSSTRTPSHYRMPLTLGLGVNTIRVRANRTGGIPSASIIKTVASPVVVALLKG